MPAEFDAVLVWGLMHEARAVRWRPSVPQLPVVLVPERTRLAWRLFPPGRMSGGGRIKRACLRARALVAGSPAARRELEAAGYPRERIFDVPLGVPLSPPRSEEAQAEARSLLAESNSALQLPLHSPLVVSTSRMAAGRGWEQLLAAWSIVARQKAAARLWLAGEVPAACVIERIASLGLNGRAIPIGMFDDVECLLAAADVHVAPAPTAPRRPCWRHYPPARRVWRSTSR